MYNIVIADDHHFTLIGTKRYLEQLGHIVIETYSNGQSCLNGILTFAPDLAIIDVNMPGLNGLEILKSLQIKKLKTKVVILTMHKEMSIYLKSKEFGGYGYLLKDFAHLEMEACINDVVNGEYFESAYLKESLIIDPNIGTDKELTKLTFVERKVLELIGQQYSNKKVAELLFIAEKTVESHKRNIAEKLGLPKERNALLIWTLNRPKF